MKVQLITAVEQILGNAIIELDASTYVSSNEQNCV